MKRRSHSLLLAILALALASLACQALGGTAPAATPAPQETESPVSPATEMSSQPALEPATIASQGIGILCIGSGTGLSCLSEKGWQVYTDKNSDLPNNYLYAGAVCPDGKIAIADISGVVLFDGTTFKQLAEMPNSASPEGIACEADGSIWVAHFQGVSRYSNGQWTTHGAEKLASGDSANELVYDVKVAPDGKVWVVTSRSVALFENNAWTIFQEGQGFQGSRFFNALALDVKGRPWAAHSDGVDVFEDGKWTSMEKSDGSSPESLAVDSKGQIWMGTLSDGVYNFDGTSWVNHDRSSESLPSNHVTSISADSSGRVWFGTSYGLTVFDGSKWQTFLMKNSGLGDNDIAFVVSTKDGPGLPALEEKANGSLTGKLEKADGTALADATVQICVETLASTFSGDTPCSDQPFFLSTKTDANGVFIIEMVPAGYYVIVADTGGGNWAQLTDQYGISSERTLIQAGETYDLQTLTVKE